MTTVLLAEDHQVVRQALRLLLEAEPDLRVIGEASDGIEALNLVQSLKPDVLLLDLGLPGLSGLEVTREVHQKWPQTRVVILSMHSNEAYVLEALRNGATGYVLKDSGAEDLFNAIRQAALGRRHLSPPLSERAIEFYASQAQAGKLEMYDTITSRERQVLQLAAEGLSNAEIAARLSISPRTAEAHRASLKRKLGLRNQGEMVRYAVDRGLLPEGPGPPPNQSQSQRSGHD